MSDEYEPCDKCGNDRTPDDLTSVDLRDDWLLCSACIDALSDSIEFHDWRDVYTEEQHQRAADELSSFDEVQCVISSYDDGQLIVHTPYVSSDIVADVCTHFGHRIQSFSIVWNEESSWPCIDEHGSTFQIVLRYDQRSKPPAPMDTLFFDTYIDEVRDHDRQF